MTIKCEKSDGLTFGSYNLNSSIVSVNESIYNILKRQDRFVACLLNISNFKSYNYRFGYEYGDMLLQIVFDKVVQIIKKNGYVHRFGGNILLILYNGIKDKKQIVSLINIIINELSGPVSVGKDELRILIDIGVSIYPDDSRNINDIVKYAEISMNYNKIHYVDKYKFFEYKMYKDIISKWAIEKDIISAIYNSEFTVHYQPIVDTDVTKVHGVEALLRWNHPKYGLVFPSYFIDIVEQNGMINKIGKFVFKEACRQLGSWHKLGYSNLIMSVNISEKQLEESSFLGFIEEVLKENKIESKYINIEITERILMNPTEPILNMLYALRDKGIKIFIDDFGTKYSSLNYLYRFPIDGIKIDKSFIDKIQYSKKEFIITKHIISLAYELNLEVIAEGIEQDEQLECLKSINCTKVQGYIFGRPVNVSDFENYLIKFNRGL